MQDMFWAFQQRDGRIRGRRHCCGRLMTFPHASSLAVVASALCPYTARWKDLAASYEAVTCQRVCFIEPTSLASKCVNKHVHWSPATVTEPTTTSLSGTVTAGERRCTALANMAFELKIIRINDFCIARRSPIMVGAGGRKGDGGRFCPVCWLYGRKERSTEEPSWPTSASCQERHPSTPPEDVIARILIFSRANVNFRCVSPFLGTFKPST